MPWNVVSRRWLERWLLPCTILVGCSGHDNRPTAATALAATFAPEVVGELVPEPPRAGDYAMTLAMKFHTYLSMEMEISEQRAGAATLALAADGTAHACFGLRVHHRMEGQLHYVEPAKRQPPDDAVRASLQALTGTWKVVDGVAEIRFDRAAKSTCSTSTTTAAPVIELRCIAVGRTNHVPDAGLACEASASSDLELTMPMTTASRRNPEQHYHEQPSGRNLVFGSSGLDVDVEQDDSNLIPTISFQARTVQLVESDYR